MAISNLSAAGYSQLYESLPFNGSGRFNATNANGGQVSEPISNPSAANNSDNVSLSGAAQALQTQSLSPDIQQEEQLLTTLADKSLAALGIVSTADESSTQVSFDSVSYSAVSSASSSVVQQVQSSGSSQSIVQGATDSGLALTGEGEIVTADGQHFQFQIELQLDQNAQASISSNATNSQIAGLSNSEPTWLLGNSAGSNAQVSENSQQAYGLSLSPDGKQFGSETASPAMIDWDAVRKQTEALFAMLDSLANLQEPSASAISSLTTDSSSAVNSVTSSSSTAVATSSSSDSAVVYTTSPDSTDETSDASPVTVDASATAAVAAPATTSVASATSTDASTPATPTVSSTPADAAAAPIDS